MHTGAIMGLGPDRGSPIVECNVSRKVDFPFRPVP
jgi:hypothetical protein